MSKFVVPFGAKYTFDPEDHQLMVYLSCKANGKQLPCDDFITEIDLYSIVDPWELFSNIDSRNDTIHVFTKLKKLSKSGQNVKRKVSNNRFWKGLDKEQPIHDAAGCLVGQKKKFSFMNNMKMNLGYHMTEFGLDEKSLGEAKFKDYVVCKIKRNMKKKRGGEPNIGFQENTPTTVLAPTAPLNSAALAASSTPASDLPINNGEKDFVGLSNPPQIRCSQYDVERTLNEYNASPELPDVDESRLQDMMNELYSLI